MTLYAAYAKDDPLLYAAGSAQVLGGATSSIGSAYNSLAMTRVGGAISLAGTAITLPMVAGDIYKDLSSGDNVRAINGVLKAAAAAPHPAGFLAQSTFELLAIRAPAYLSASVTPGIYGAYGMPFFAHGGPHL